MAEHTFQDIQESLADDPSIYEAIDALTARVEAVEASIQAIQDDHAAILDVFVQIVRIITRAESEETSPAP